MPKPSKGPRLGGGPAHERLLLANLSSALFTHKSITTTEAKAKRLRPFAERLITFAKRGDLHARRRVMTVIRDKTVVHELFTEIAPLVAERQGGYTRIVKTGFRKGDNAPMAVIELVLEPVQPKKGAKAKTETMAPAEPVASEEPETAADEAAAESAADESVAESAETTADAQATEPVEDETAAEPTDSAEAETAESDPAAVSSEGTVTVDVPVPAEETSESEDADAEAKADEDTKDSK